MNNEKILPPPKTPGLRDFIAEKSDRILITGAGGFIGSRVVQSLLDQGFRNLICFGRPSGKLAGITEGLRYDAAFQRVNVVEGNLLSSQDCEAACADVKVVFHLAAGTGEKSFPDAVMNSVVTTRNLLEACLRCTSLKRFVLVSSFTVYTNQQRSRRLDESSPVEEYPQLRGDAYCYAKSKQEEILREYGKQHGIPYAIVRPGSVYGPGRPQITGRVGLGTFGLFLHLGGSNAVPFTYVDNCASAIALAGLVKGVDGEVFNVVDDDIPSSRYFLRLYKAHIKNFRSLYVPHAVSYMLCSLWGRYSARSQGQLPPAFNRSHWYSQWRKTHYSNAKLKTKLGWRQVVSTEEALQRFVAGCRQGNHHA
jgi:nucleoside-diphosphate-sugar epimerase